MGAGASHSDDSDVCAAREAVRSTKWKIEWENKHDQRLGNAEDPPYALEKDERRLEEALENAERRSKAKSQAMEDAEFIARLRGEDAAQAELDKKRGSEEWKEWCRAHPNTLERSEPARSSPESSPTVLARPPTVLARPPTVLARPALPIPTAKPKAKSYWQGLLVGCQEKPLTPTEHYRARVTLSGRSSCGCDECCAWDIYLNRRRKAACRNTRRRTKAKTNPTPKEL